MRGNEFEKLIVFDVDGVLISTQLGASKDILVNLGKKKEVECLDREYQRRKKKGPFGMEKLIRLYKGFAKKQLQEESLKYCQSHLMKGAKRCLEKLKGNGWRLGALSSNMQFVMNTLLMILPLDFAEGTKIKFEREVSTGEILRVVTRYEKAEILERKVKNYGVKKENVVVVGDSITDLPMGEKSGFFVAFQPKSDIVKEKADLVVDHFSQLEAKLL
ncbi:haloacid dehalogenase-like hydrolase [bacterium]|nr:haloacid dehalogenase-like hydrolase [bacterium]